MSHLPRTTRRMCPQHHQRPVSHLCLRDNCECSTLICIDCLKESHRNAPNCPIVRTEQPLSISNINNNKMHHFQEFQAILGQFSEIWESGSQMMQKQLEEIQNNFLLPVNAMCKTFAEQTPAQIQQSLLTTKNGPSQSETQPCLDAKILKLYAINKNKLSSVEQIKSKSQEINQKVTYMLLRAFKQFQMNMMKINKFVKEESIFNIPQPVVSKQRQNELQKTGLDMPQSLLQETKQRIQVNKQKIHINTSNEQPHKTFFLTKANEDLLQNGLQKSKSLCIKSCTDPNAIIEKLLNVTQRVEDLIIETPSLANQSVIPFILSLFTHLKSVSFNCDNELYKCYKDIHLYDNSNKKRYLDRFQYFYQYRRFLQNLDQDIYFKTSKIPKDVSLKIHFFNYKQVNYWSAYRKSIPIEALPQIVHKMQPKNLWLQNLDDATFKIIKEHKVSFSNFEELTFGRYQNASTHIPTQIQNHIKSAKNLKCLVFIKSVHLASNLQEILKQMSNLEVLVLDEFLCSGATMQHQKLYDCLPACCPKLKKLWISNLKLIDISFVASLKDLVTLILPSSNQLDFKSQQQLNLTHVNLYGASWNFIPFLNVLNPNTLTYLNIGQSSLSPSVLDLLYSFLLKCKQLTCLCLDKMKLSNQIVTTIENNKQTLIKLSLFNCKSQDMKGLLPLIQRCRKLKVLDVNSCVGLQNQILSKIPQPLQNLVVSRNSLNKLLAQGIKISNLKCNIIQID